jgi:hypothetical protein
MQLHSVVLGSYHCPGFPANPSVFVCTMLRHVMQITVLCQQVVLQELPVPRVTLPRNDSKPLDAAAAAANSMLTKQRRVQLLLPPTQMTRLSGLLAQVIQPAAAAAPTAAAATGDDKGEEQPAKGRGRGGRAQQEKKRESTSCAAPVAMRLLLQSTVCRSVGFKPRRVCFCFCWYICWV